MGDTKPSKGEFLPSDVWARNVEGWKPDSKKQADNNITLIALAVLLIAFAAASWQWLIPAVKQSDQALLDQLRALQQRNLLLASHLRDLDLAHQTYMHSRKLMAAAEQPVEDDDHWTALHATTQQLLAANSQQLADSPPLNQSTDASSNESTGSQASAFMASSQSVINTGSAMRNNPSAASTTKELHTSKDQYKKLRVDRSSAWRTRRANKGKKQRKMQREGRQTAKIRREKRAH